MSTVNLDTCHECYEVNPCLEPVYEQTCPIKLDLSCSIYNKKTSNTNKLPNLGIPNGVDAKTIIEKIDEKFGRIQPFIFGSYDLSCLVSNTITKVTTLPQFVNLVSKTLCTIKEDLLCIQNTYSTNINNITNIVNTNNKPNISDGCGLGIVTSDTVKDVLIKLKDGYCSLKSSIVTENSPLFTAVNSNTISWIPGGLKNHSPIANVKKSNQSGNILQILSDGLFVGQLTPPSQVLGYSPSSKTITLSNGGGQVTLPPEFDSQTLAFNSSTNILQITNGNSVDLSSLSINSETELTPIDTDTINLTVSGDKNHTLQANTRISLSAGNIISANPDGLFASYTDLNDKVKASSTGTTGYLIEKIEGCVNGSLTLTVNYNPVTDKITFCGNTNVSNLLNEISLSPTLRGELCDIVQNCLCFTFKIRNTDTNNAKNYSYIDCNGTNIGPLSIGANNSVEVCGRSVSVTDDAVYVFNLGYCIF